MTYIVSNFATPYYRYNFPTSLGSALDQSPSSPSSLFFFICVPFFCHTLRVFPGPVARVRPVVHRTATHTAASRAPAHHARKHPGLAIEIDAAGCACQTQRVAVILVLWTSRRAAGWLWSRCSAWIDGHARCPTEKILVIAIFGAGWRGWLRW
jgi:hypothetical protein